MFGSLQTNGKAIVKEDSGIKFINLLLYVLILAVPGYFLNQLTFPADVFSGAKGLIWFSYFMLITFGFSPIRKLVVPLLNFKAMKDPKSYLFIFLTFMIPYILLHLCVHFEVLLNKYFIFDFKHNLIGVSSLGATFNSVLLTPISEEILFRGVLLVVLLKYMKPFWAISITAILFGLIHLSTVWIFPLVGGILLTITVYKTRSLIPAVIAHALWNLYLTQLFIYF
jgi:membrane protease YdiL (CAAX protease family)